jgi:hypothetical protein
MWVLLIPAQLAWKWQLFSKCDTFLLILVFKCVRHDLTRLLTSDSLGSTHENISWQQPTFFFLFTPKTFSLLILDLQGEKCWLFPSSLVEPSKLDVSNSAYDFCFLIQYLTSYIHDPLKRTTTKHSVKWVEKSFTDLVSLLLFSTANIELENVGEKLVRLFF